MLFGWIVVVVGSVCVSVVSMLFYSLVCWLLWLVSIS